jgi:hypothetical protein
MFVSIPFGGRAGFEVLVKVVMVQIKEVISDYCHGTVHIFFLRKYISSLCQGKSLF